MRNPEGCSRLWDPMWWWSFHVVVEFYLSRLKTIKGVTSDYYLLSNSGLSTSPGTGLKQTIDVSLDRGVGDSLFKLFGTWTAQF